MNSLPGQQTTGRLRPMVNALRQEVDEIKAMRAPGILTSNTTRGTFQSSKPQQVATVGGTSKPATVIPRWG